MSHVGHSVFSAIQIISSRWRIIACLYNVIISESDMVTTDFLLIYKVVFFRLWQCRFCLYRDTTATLGCHILLLVNVSQVVPANEPHHAKTCLRGFSTRYDSNQPAQPQKLARLLKLCI